MQEYFNNLFFSGSIRYLVEFIVFTFFFTLGLIALFEITNFIREDRHLAKHHYKVWKMTKGTLKQRKRAYRGFASDSYLNKMNTTRYKVWNILLGIWLAISIFVASAVFVINKLNLMH